MLQRRTPMKRTAFARKAAPAPAPREERPLKPVQRPSLGRRGVYVRASDAVSAAPKQPREKCQHLLDMACGQPCLFWFVAGCRRDWDTGERCTTVKAHDNRLSSNKGRGYKAHDWASLDACKPCHDAYDTGTAHTREEKDAAFDAAMPRQLQKYRDIVANPLAKQKDKDAAQWAIQRYEHHRNGTQA